MKHSVFGLIIAGLGIWGIVSWWDVFGLVMRGVVPFGLLVFGLVAILSGYSKGSQKAAAPAPPQEKNAEPTDGSPTAAASEG